MTELKKNADAILDACLESKQITANYTPMSHQEARIDASVLAFWELVLGQMSLETEIIKLFEFCYWRQTDRPTDRLAAG